MKIIRVIDEESDRCFSFESLQIDVSENGILIVLNGNFSTGMFIKCENPSKLTSDLCHALPRVNFIEIKYGNIFNQIDKRIYDVEENCKKFENGLSQIGEGYDKIWDAATDAYMLGLSDDKGFGKMVKMAFEKNGIAWDDDLEFVENIERAIHEK